MSADAEEPFRIQRVVIVGVGSLACLFGGKLACYLPVTLVGRWPQQVIALRRSGLTLIDPAGGRDVQPLVELGSESGVTGLSVAAPGETLAPAQLVLVAVKSAGTAAAVRWVHHYLDPTEGAAVAVTLQNGLGNLAHLAEAVGASRAALGVTTQGAHVVEPGIVRHAGEGLTQLAGPGALAPQLRQVAEVFNRAGLPTACVDNADGLLWGKLAVNAAINPLAALLGRPNGVLLATAPAERLLRRVAWEVEVVAAAVGVELPFDGVERAVEVCRATAGNRGSMLQDLTAGRQTEVDVINGAVALEASRHGVRAPLNELLTRLMRAAEAGEPVAVSAWQEALQAATAWSQGVEDLHWLRRQLELRAG